MADGGPFGEMVLGEHHAHHMDSVLQKRCQEKAPTGQSSTQGQWGQQRERVGHILLIYALPSWQLTIKVFELK